MRHRRAMPVMFLAAVAVSGMVLLAAPTPAQQPAAVEQIGSFTGLVLSNVDRSPVRSADIRITRVDSVRARPTPTDPGSIEIFSDSVGPRFAATDSTGAFAMDRVPAGRYLVNVRRIGFEPLQAVLSIDTGVVRASLVMHQVSKMLAAVVITESSIDKVKLTLDRDGFTWRSRAEASGKFVTRAEILHRQSSTATDLLAYYGIREGDANEFLLDDMRVDYDYLRSYPADLVIGVEIYPRARPIEYTWTRHGGAAFSSGSLNSHALVLIWTRTR